MNYLKKEHFKRCVGKRRYRTGELADAAAQRASERSGELIISYECYDCGRWHIGHADASQIAARKPVKPLCVICQRPIPEQRRQQARRSGNLTTTCSQPCAKQLKRERKAPRPASSEDGSKGSPQQPS